MTTHTAHQNPTWWDTANDSGWDRIKDALKRDWDQTKHDLGGSTPNLNQHITDTLKQAAGKEPIPPSYAPPYDEAEAAFRYGYGARYHYGADYPEWDDELEARLKHEWGTLEPSRKDAWDRDRELIRHAWEFEE